MTNDEMAKFLVYAGDLFKRGQIWRLHLFATIGGLVGAAGSYSITKDSRGMGYVLVMIVGANLFITAAHYHSAWRMWKRRSK